jgi:UDP-N-acetylmuramoylalanine--D-glutamate ligase
MVKIQHLVNSVSDGWNGRKIYFGLDTPAPGQLGLVEELLIDRAFVVDPMEAGAICELNEVQPTVPAFCCKYFGGCGLSQSSWS